MRTLAALTFVTLDGAMQSPSMPDEDPSGGFAQGGWAAPYWDEVMPNVQQEAMSEPYEMVFGRKTYDIFARNWPNAPKSELSDMTNAARKYVVTSDPSSLDWVNSVGITGNIAKEIQQLKQQDGPLLQIHGSAQLIRTLLTYDLIDEFRMWVFPVTVGSGKRLFESGCPPLHLTRIKSHTSTNGVSMQFYRHNRTT